MAALGALTDAVRDSWLDLPERGDREDGQTDEQAIEADVFTAMVEGDDRLPALVRALVRETKPRRV